MVFRSSVKVQIKYVVSLEVSGLRKNAMKKEFSALNKNWIKLTELGI